MMSFEEKDLEALALLEPQKNDPSFAYNGALVTRAYESVVGLSTKNPVKWLRAAAKAYRRHRERGAAKFKLYAMSDRQLRDIGLTQSQIYHAVERTKEKRKLKFPAFFRFLAKRFSEASRVRKAYVNLLVMDSRQLADIGLTRGDIQAVRNGVVRDFANCNRLHASNNNDRRRAS